MSSSASSIRPNGLLPQWQHHHRTAALPGGIDLDLDSSEFARHWNHGWRGGMGVLGFKDCPVGSDEVLSANPAG